MLRNLLANIGLSSSDAPPVECARIQSHIFDYIDGGLPAADRALVDQHLAQCHACALEWAACQRSEGVLKTASSTIPSPGDLRPGFYAKLEQSRRRHPLLAGWPRTATALAGTILVGLLARQLLGTHPQSSKEQASPQMQAVVPHGETRFGVGSPLIDNIPGQTRQDAFDNTSKHQVRLRRPANSLMASQGKPSHHPTRTYITGLFRFPAQTGFSVLRTVRAKRSKAGPGTLWVSGPVHTGRSDRAVLVAALSRKTGRVETARKPSMSLNVVQDSEATLAASPGAAAASDQPMAKSHASGVVLASVYSETELHVSDDNRDFMSSTHVADTPKDRGKSIDVRVDDDNGAPAEPVELPPLP